MFGSRRAHEESRREKSSAFAAARTSTASGGAAVSEDHGFSGELIAFTLYGTLNWTDVGKN